MEKSISPHTEALLNHYLPQFDESEHHSIYVKASPEGAYQAVLNARLGSSLLVQALYVARALPSLLLGRSCDVLETRHATLLDLIGHGFFLVDEQPGREIVLGAIGRFWKLKGEMMKATAEDLEYPTPPGMATALWNFRVTRYAHGSMIHTETRIRCGDEKAQRSFRRYWRLIGPFSALIRVSMLKAIKDDAESIGP